MQAPSWAATGKPPPSLSSQKKETLCYLAQPGIPWGFPRPQCPARHPVVLPWESQAQYHARLLTHANPTCHPKGNVACFCNCPLSTHGCSHPLLTRIRPATNYFHQGDCRINILIFHITKSSLGCTDTYILPSLQFFCASEFSKYS